MRKLGPNLEDASRHHRFPQRNGVCNKLFNLVLICVKCHVWIHKHERLAAEEGWILPSLTAAVPLRRWDGWVLLRENGSVEHLSEFAGKALLTWATDRLYLEGLARSG